ncbi:c-type cytochrome [Steroidobacter sp.]|uniref:c-type cytochrome n=1 Tax=Steroidobacter sp. TaxID=1978227 RepID=UPI001A4D01C4|nr:c-type cytochrome [Steroidobacter sp.]MBL8267617.1 c-type cytochrome [Steroidobacter sp.]
MSKSKLTAQCAAALIMSLASLAGGADQPASVAATAPAKATPPEPPPHFALCSACHPISADGANAMGPNLRGVFGRRAGALSGFAYSAAMRKSELQWTRETLHAYLRNPAATVPGNMMAYGGLSDAADRDLIIDYLEQLK